MYNIIKVGEKDVPMLSMASVDIYYRNIFHEDAIKLQTKTQDDGDIINFIMRMGFVMAKFAELKDRKEMNKLNEDSFIAWLDGFERTDLINALVDVRMTYEGQSVSHSDSKKRTKNRPTNDNGSVPAPSRPNGS